MFVEQPLALPGSAKNICIVAIWVNNPFKAFQATHIIKCVLTKFLLELVELAETNIPDLGTDCGAGWEGTLGITER